MAHVTSADVARRAGVSRTTVSFVLNGSEGHRIPEQTRRRVMEAAQDLGYRPNLAAKTLAAGRSGIIIFVIPDVLLGALTFTITSFLTSELARHGLTLIVQFEIEGSRPLTEVVADLRPRAVIHMFEPTVDTKEGLEASGVASYSAIAPTGTAGTLESLIGEMQVAHLVERGHSSIGFADPAEPGLEGLSSQRFIAVKEACARRGLRQPYPVSFDLQAISAPHGAQQLADAGVTAICAYNDDVALVVLAGIHAIGLDSPSDLAVIGVDNIVAGASSWPPLSTIELRPLAVAQLVVDAVLERLGIAEDENGTTEVAAALALIPRAST